MLIYIIVESRKGATVLGLGVFYTAFVMQYKKIINMFFLFFFCPTFSKVEKSRAKMPEWSKGVDLRSTVFARVGSNPTFGNWGARLGSTAWGARIGEHG